MDILVKHKSIATFYQNFRSKMKIDYNGRKFRTVSNSRNGLTSHETIFEYKQSGKIVSAFYSGGNILYGHLLGLVDDSGCIDMRYHQISMQNQIRTGACHSKPEVLENGKIRLHENWQWTSGDFSSGYSIIEEF